MPKNPVRLIVTDLDRTLLHTNKTISDYTAEVLHQCRLKDIKIVFATARPKRTVNHLAFIKNSLVDALILHNGAVTYIGEKMHTCFSISQTIRDDMLQSIAKNFPESKLSVEIDDVLYANFDVHSVWPETISTLTDFSDCKGLPDKPADKIIVGASSTAELERFAKYIPDTMYIEMTTGDSMNIGMVMNKAASKWAGTQAIAAHFGISTANTVAFGDDYNDITMIAGCAQSGGIGVAVSNAISEVKAIANDLCDINDNDGVAKWLESNVL